MKKPYWLEAARQQKLKRDRYMRKTCGNDTYIGSKSWEKAIIKAIKEGKVKYTLPKIQKESPYPNVRRAQYFLRSILTNE